jgi:hypothetical protein
VLLVSESFDQLFLPECTNQFGVIAGMKLLGLSRSAKEAGDPRVTFHVGLCSAR